MNLFGWIGQRIKLTNHRFWAQYVGGESWTGEPMSPTLAMQNSAFWSGIRISSQTIGSLGMALYRKQAGGRIEITDTDLYRVLAISPDGFHTALEFWEGVATCIFLTGNGYALKKFADLGRTRLIGLELLNPNQVNPNRNNVNRTLVYDYVDLFGRRHVYAPDEIFHIRGFGICGDVGLSAVQYGSQTLGIARAGEKVAGKTFANGMRSSGYLFSKQMLTPDQRAMAKEKLIDPFTGTDNAGSVGIIEAEMFDFKAMQIPPHDAELLESRRFSIEEVCRFIGIPPVLVGHASAGQTMWGTGIGQIIGGWYTLGLRPILRRIEKAIGMQLIPALDRGKVYAEFTVEELLRADPAARGEFYWKLMQVGAITPNQVCDAENYPQFEGGDQHFANSTLAPIGPDGMLVKSNPLGVNPAQPGQPGQPGQPPQLPPPSNGANDANDVTDYTGNLYQSIENMSRLLRVVK